MPRGLVKDTSKKLLLSIFLRKLSHAPNRNADTASVFSDLERHGYLIRANKKTDTAIRKLTDKGLRAACFLQMKHEHDDQKFWDNHWRIIIFDIPEEHALIRDLFRRFLKQSGFVQLQKSVWITPRAIEKTLKIFIEQLRIEQWAHIIVVKTMTNDDELKKKFGL